MGKLSGICRLCNENKKFAKAHVISRSLFKAIFKANKKTHLINVTDLDGENSVQDAFYDYHILCEDCDKSFSPYEDYFNQFIKGDLLKKKSIIKYKISDHRDYILDSYNQVDHFKLRMFFLITIWRCSISKQKSFKAVSLGPYEAIIVKQLRSGVLSSYDALPVILLSLENVDDVRASAVFEPCKGKIEEIPITILSINHWAIIYCMRRHIKPWLFNYRSDDSGELNVIKLKHESGLVFLDNITHLKVHVRKSEVLDS